MLIRVVPFPTGGVTSALSIGNALLSKNQTNQGRLLKRTTALGPPMQLALMVTPAWNAASLREFYFGMTGLLIAAIILGQVVGHKRNIGK